MDRRRDTVFPGSRSYVTRKIPLKVVAHASNTLTPIHSGTPWKAYAKNWTVGKHRRVVVVHQITAPHKLLTARIKPCGSHAERQLSAARQLRHENIVPIHEIFLADHEIYILSPYYDISLEGVNASPLFPDDIQVATIASEVRCALLMLV